MLADPPADPRKSWRTPSADQLLVWGWRASPRRTPPFLWIGSRAPPDQQQLGTRMVPAWYQNATRLVPIANQICALSATHWHQIRTSLLPIWYAKCTWTGGPPRRTPANPPRRTPADPPQPAETQTRGLGTEPYGYHKETIRRPQETVGKR